MDQAGRMDPGIPWEGSNHASHAQGVRRGCRHGVGLGRFGTRPRFWGCTGAGLQEPTGLGQAQSVVALDRRQRDEGGHHEGPGMDEASRHRRHAVGRRQLRQRPDRREEDRVRKSRVAGCRPPCRLRGPSPGIGAGHLQLRGLERDRRAMGEARAGDEEARLERDGGGRAAKVRRQADAAAVQQRVVSESGSWRPGAAAGPHLLRRQCGHRLPHPCGGGQHGGPASQGDDQRRRHRCNPAVRRQLEFGGRDSPACRRWHCLAADRVRPALHCSCDHDRRKRRHSGWPGAGGRRHGASSNARDAAGHPTLPPGPDPHICLPRNNGKDLSHRDDRSAIGTWPDDEPAALDSRHSSIRSRRCGCIPAPACTGGRRRPASATCSSTRPCRPPMSRPTRRSGGPMWSI